MEQYDVVIVGACTAGTYFSSLLAKEGLKVLVIDKDKEENLSKRLDIFHFTRDSYKDFDIEESKPGDEEFVRYFDVCYSKSALDNYLKTLKELPCALYITSPDYLGNTADIKEIKKVLNKYDIYLLVDNAHGAYLKFLDDSLFPIDLGADMCASSAHKTLPVLTGGGYLHISRSLPDFFSRNAKTALALFGSTSPSYLILESLDLANRYISDGYRVKLENCIEKIRQIKDKLIKKGFSLKTQAN